MEEAELIQANPQYAFVRLKGGHETTVSLRDLAPCHRSNFTKNNNVEENEGINQKENVAPSSNSETDNAVENAINKSVTDEEIHYADETSDVENTNNESIQQKDLQENFNTDNYVRRSNRSTRKLQLFADSDY